MLSGSIELEMRQRTYTVNEGDAVYFASEVPSSWRNNSEKPAKLLWILFT
ncbi:MAG: cupin domain-containing protein [Endomicrobiales bacterium]